MRDKINTYINDILQSVLNIEEHDNIRDELKDHLLTQVEEKMNNGMKEEEAINQAILSMGKPKNLAKKFNSIYKVNKIPLFTWAGMNLIFLLFISYLLPAFNAMRTLDILAILFVSSLSLVSLYSSGKQFYYLKDVQNNSIYYASVNSKTYTQKVIYKLVVVLFTALLLYFSYGLFMVIQKDLLKKMIQDNSYFALLNLGIWSNYAFSYIVSYNYPSILLTDKGIYRLGELPRRISWESIKGYEWNKILGKYHLSLLKGNYFKKVRVPAKLETSDKIIIDTIIKSKKDLKE